MSDTFQLHFTDRPGVPQSVRQAVEPLLAAFPSTMTLADIETESALIFRDANGYPITRLTEISAARLHAIADAARREERVTVSAAVRDVEPPTSGPKILAGLEETRRQVLGTIDVITEALALMGATKAVREVLAERQRQVQVEGFDQAHDAEREPSELADAAACYAIAQERKPPMKDLAVSNLCEDVWPWPIHEFKPKDWRRNCVRAAALLVAALELDDLQQQRLQDAERTGGSAA